MLAGLLPRNQMVVSTVLSVGNWGGRWHLRLASWPIPRSCTKPQAAKWRVFTARGVGSKPSFRETFFKNPLPVPIRPDGGTNTIVHVSRTPVQGRNMLLRMLFKAIQWLKFSVQVSTTFVQMPTTLVQGTKTISQCLILREIFDFDAKVLFRQFLQACCAWLRAGLSGR